MGAWPTIWAWAKRRRCLRCSNSAARPEPSHRLIVVPRSLVYNWKQEAARFTPKLKILDHTVADRNKQVAGLQFL